MVLESRAKNSNLYGCCILSGTLVNSQTQAIENFVSIDKKFNRVYNTANIYDRNGTKQSISKEVTDVIF